MELGRSSKMNEIMMDSRHEALSLVGCDGDLILQAKGQQSRRSTCRCGLQHFVMLDIVDHPPDADPPLDDART